MTRKLENLEISAEDTFRTALASLNATGGEILLVLDSDGRLLRTVTDGDIRRQLLGGFSLEDRVGSLPKKEPVTAPEDVEPGSALEIMDESGVDQLVVVTEDGKPLSIILRRDLSTRILLSTPHLGDEEMQFVKQAFATNWIAPLGPHVDAFEEELADYLDLGSVAAVSSGTAAIHLALRILGIDRGDVVLCSTLTFVGSLNPVLYERATPVLIDSEPESWNMSPVALERALKDCTKRGLRPKAAIIVNLYGQSADFAPLRKLCDAYGVSVIEDAAESLGATYKGAKSGTFGDLGILSFNGNKIITTSGGGAIVSNSSQYIDKARFLATQAKDPAPYYQHSEIGFNYRMSNVLAGIGRGQLRVLDDRVRARRNVFDRYDEGLRDVEAIRWMPEASYGRSTRWLSVGTIDPGYGIPDDLLRSLAADQIEGRRVWKPMHQQPLCREFAYYAHDEGSSCSDDLFERGFCLPSGSNLRVDQQEKIIRSIRSHFLGRREARG